MNPLALPKSPRSARQRGARYCVLALSLASVFLAACHKLEPVDSRPLDTAGLTYESIKQLKALDISDAEVSQIAMARAAGLSDSGCVESLRISRARKEQFKLGQTIAELLRSGMREDSILELDRINQLGVGVGELQAIHLLGFPDEVVVDVAHRRASNLPVLSGAALGKMKNTGMRTSTLRDLVVRGVPDSQADAIIAARRHGMSDAEILRHFAGA